jgi:GTP-binding protein
MMAISPPIAKLLRVAIVGRSNVGKSTLFNRLVGQKIALVDDTPGVTRDRREGIGHLGDLTFQVIDTAGLEQADRDTIAERMRRQTEAAIEETDVALMLIDARVGITPTDRHFAQSLRRSKAKIFLVANKCEGRASNAGLIEAFELGLGEPIAISAEHGEGLSELFDALAPLIDRPVDAAEESEEDPTVVKPMQLAVVGRPNVGKSTLINQLVGTDRLLTGPEAGLTRDAIAVPFTYRGRSLKLTDTAGLRRKSHVSSKLEKLSVADTLRAINFAEIVVLVIDGTVGLDKQDLTIASMVVEEGRGMVVAVNKWDAVEDRTAVLKTIADRLEFSLPQVKGIPVVTVSALTGRSLDKLMEAVFALHALWATRLGTADINRWLERALDQHPPPLVSGRRVKIRYATQIKARPPTVALFSSRPEELPESYLRYLMHHFRDHFGLVGVPVRLVLRKGKNPYAED